MLLEEHKSQKKIKKVRIVSFLATICSSKSLRFSQNESFLLKVNFAASCHVIRYSATLTAFRLMVNFLKYFLASCTRWRASHKPYSRSREYLHN